MTADANVTNAEPAIDGVGEQPAEPTVAEAAPPKQQRTWSMPKSPVSREQADEMGRLAVKAIRSIATAVAVVGRAVTHAVREVWQVFQAVPPAVRLFFVASTLMLLAIAGAVTLHDTVGLICTVVIIPLCAAIIGALGHRWYSGLGVDATRSPRAIEPAASDLQRSVEYVDKKLGQALTSFGTEHHQQAVIALFQAKTAVELTLGTEQDTASYVDVPLRAEDYGLRPRIKAGSTSALRESNSLAAS